MGEFILVMIGIYVLYHAILGIIESATKQNSSTNYQPNQNFVPTPPPIQTVKPTTRTTAQRPNSFPSHSSTYDYRGEFQVKAKLEMIGDNKEIPLIVIEGRGHLPVEHEIDAEFVTLAQDATNHYKAERVECKIDDFKDSGDDTYKFIKNIGLISSSSYFRDWVTIAYAPAEELIFSRGGLRKIKFYSFVRQKMSLGPMQLLTPDGCEIYYKFDGLGYDERNDKKIDSLKAIINLGVAMAFVDNEFDESEAAVIKNWIKDQLDEFDDDAKNDAKKQLNEEAIQCVNLAPHAKIDLVSATTILRNSPYKNSPYEALELCTIIMAADGVIKQAEMQLLNKFAEMLGVENKQLRGLIDKHSAHAVTTSNDGELTDELLVGLNPSLPLEEIKKEIRRIFSRYNGFLNSEKDPIKRQRYQDCIDAAARLKKKYG